MKRRDFFKSGLIGLSLPSFLLGKSTTSRNINNPVNCSGNCYEPIANAGESKTYFQGSTVILDGSLSYDPEGESLTYLWSAPDGISLSDNTLQMPTFTAPNEDVILSFSLIVNDGEYQVAWPELALNVSHTILSFIIFLPAPGTIPYVQTV